MGSYDSSCQISGVHISYNQNAVLLLTEDSPYKDCNGFPAQIKGIPIHCAYADYGEFTVSEQSIAHYQIMLKSMTPDYVLQSGFISFSQENEDNTIQSGRVYGINLYTLSDKFYHGLCEIKYHVKQMISSYVSSTGSSEDEVLSTYPSSIQQWINESNSDRTFAFLESVDIFTLIQNVHSLSELNAMVSRIVQYFFVFNTPTIPAIQSESHIPYDIFQESVKTLTDSLTTVLDWKVIDADIYQALIKNGLKHKFSAYSGDSASKTVSLSQLYTKSKSWSTFMQVVSALRKHHLQFKQDISQAIKENTLSFLEMKRENRLFKLTVDDKVGVSEKTITWKLFHSMYLNSGEAQYTIENQWFGALPDDLTVENFQDEWQKCVAFTKNFYNMLNFIPIRQMQTDTSQIQQCVSKATIAHLKKQKSPTLEAQYFYSRDATLLKSII